MIWSKSCEKKSSHHRLHNKKHRVTAPLISKSKSQKKRKFDWYIYDETINFDLVGREKNDSEYVKDHRRCSPSPHSCLTLADKKHVILQRTKEHVFPILDDGEEYCGINMEDYSRLSKLEDSINGSSYPVYQGSLKIQRSDLTGISSSSSSSSSSSNFFISTKTPLKDTPRIEFVETLKDKLVDEDFTDGKTSLLLSKTKEDTELIFSVSKSVDEDFTDGKTSLLLSKTKEDAELICSVNKSVDEDFIDSKTSLLLSKTKEDTELICSVSKSVDEDFTDSNTSLLLSKTKEDTELTCSVSKYLPTRGNHLPRPVIPIGPMFQADIPKWEGSTDVKHYNGDYGLKWLGTQIWPIPIPSISETNTRDIYKGILDLCSLDDLNKILQ
ncbi:hypothetical protein P8452_60005 [Trifolium repens]|nr:hypothetical protein P8452_60005 [Trifolium repens]